MEGEKQTELFLGDPQLLDHERHRDAEIFTDQIKCGVTDDGEEQHSHLPAAVRSRHGLRFRDQNRRGRSRAENFKEAGNHLLAALLISFAFHYKSSLM